MSEKVTANERKNNVLFAMVDVKLDDAKDAEFLEAFEQLEHECIGPSKHEVMRFCVD